MTPRIEALLARARASRGRIVFALDATASRQPTWDTAARLTTDMFSAAAGLDVQLRTTVASASARPPAG